MRAYVVNHEHVTWRVVDDEAVIVHAKTSEYFSVNQSGTWLWNLLDTPRTLLDLSAALGVRYPHEGARTAADVEAFVAQLELAGLLREQDPRESVVTGAEAPPPRDPYEPPQLVKFGDLETLILSGE